MALPKEYVVILNKCSLVGEAVNVARNLINIPYVKIDEQMAEDTVKTGRSISLIAIVASTLGPSSRLIEDAAEKLGKEVSVKKYLVDEALKILMRGKNIEKYNRLVIDVIEKESKTCDVIALA